VALVVFLRAVNVGGHRRFRPRALAARLKQLDVVNIGAAGNFVVRRPVTRTALRAELARGLPFETEMMICGSREVLAMISGHPFGDQPERPDVVRFVSALCQRPRSTPPMPSCLPSSDAWLLKLLSTDGRFVYGLYRRHMKAIGYLGTIDRMFGVPVTTRNWNTITAIANVLKVEDRVDAR